MDETMESSTGAVATADQKKEMTRELDALREAQIDEFMGWLFRDGGAEPPRREYEATEQRLRLLVSPPDDPTICEVCGEADLDVVRLREAARRVPMPPEVASGSEQEPGLAG